MDKAYTYDKKTNDDGQTVVTITVSKEKFADEKAKTFKNLSNDVEVPGFRKGNGPQNLVEAKLGTKLYEQTLDRVLPEITFEILKEIEANPITQITYDVKKVAESEGIEYTASYIELPEFKLGNFSKIKMQSSDVEVTEEEIDKAVDQLLEMNKKQEEEGKKDDKAKAKKDDSKKKEAEKKEITDEDVKKLGVGFETVKDLREEFKKRIEEDKKSKQENERLQDMINQAIELSKVPAPKALVDSEVDRQVHDYEHRVKDLGIKLEDFLKSQNTTLEKMKEEWKKDIENKIKQELLFVQVAKENDLKVSDADIQKEIDSIMDPKVKEQYNNDRGKRYISTILLQQKAVLFIKEQAEGK